MPSAESIHPVVLISYSHDSPAHRQRVLELSERLRADGIDARLDQYSPWPEEGWPRWMDRNLREADFVLMICTATYRRRVTGEEEPGAGRGVCWEANLIYNDLYVRKVATSKYIPVVFTADDAAHIPPVLQGHPHFCVATDEGYGDLYRRLTRNPKFTPRELGDPKKLRPGQPLAATTSSPVTKAATSPSGTIPCSDPHYVSRKADEVVLQCAEETGQTLVIKGPRQMGKSSLLRHYLDACQKAGKEVAFVDFGIFSDEDLSGYPKFLSRFAQILGQRLHLRFSTPPRINSQAAMVDFMERVLLPQVGGPLVLALDEADGLAHRPYQADFFSMLRMWHNSRAFASGAWQDADLALVLSTEPYLLIDDPSRSPFNVGLVVGLEPFSREECHVLNQSYDGLLGDGEVEELWSLLKGHPYLTRLSFYRLTVPPRISFAELLERADDERGPFGDHLCALLMTLHQRPELLNAMQQVIRRGTLPERDLFYRLHAAGLVRREGQRINPANLLYARFFKNALKALSDGE